MSTHKLALATILALSVILLPGCSEDLEPVGISPSGTDEAHSLPSGTVVVDIGTTANFTAPFSADQRVDAARGTCLTIPEGAGTEDGRGEAKFEVSLPASGTYYGWVRARWNDSCGNSVLLAVGDDSPALVGGNHLYGSWHWVPVGRFQLEAGPVPVTLSEREDGVAVDQVLFTPGEDYRPFGPAGTGDRARAVRRFADDFSRSPGHGMAGWELVEGQWEIAFSFDPNRVPFQYSLRGRPDSSEDGTEAVALIEGPPWRGSRVSFSVLPLEESRFGLLLDRNSKGAELRVEMGLDSGKGQLRVEGPELAKERDLDRSLRLRQWHRVTVERWAWLLRVKVDGREVFASTDLRASVGAIGLFVGAGTVFFDDLSVEQIPWWAEDGNDLRVPWEPEGNARWFRPQRTPADFALLGRAGAISPRLSAPVRELIIQGSPAQPSPLVEGPGWQALDADTGLRIYRRLAAAETQNQPEVPGLMLRAPEEGDSRIRKLALRTGDPPESFHHIGPYHFTRARVPDPSDYLDFTEEEYQQMAASEQAETLRRKPQFQPVVARGGEKALWRIRSGTWKVADGVLSGSGPNATLRHWQEIISDVRVDLRVRLLRPESAAAIQLYARPGDGARVRIQRTQAPGGKDADDALQLPTISDSEWHELQIRVEGERLTAALDGGEVRAASFRRGLGGAVRLHVPAGQVEFDDIQFRIPRHNETGSFYGFERRETEWWREGARWIDHGGLACILASSWVSLIAPEGEGMLWNKRRPGSDLMVAFNLEENSEWHGWDKNPNHTHHPFDNVRVALSPADDMEEGYRVELNAEDRSTTVLYRNGKQVAQVAQNGDFPMRYRGGHSPYSPRKNRVSLLKRGATVRVLVNGQTILEFEDPDPIGVSRVGLGGYRTRVNFSHIEVRRLGAMPH